jgi:SAM-dependent methyltransferase
VTTDPHNRGPHLDGPHLDGPHLDGPHLDRQDLDRQDLDRQDLDRQANADQDKADAHTRELAASAAQDPTAWFEVLYADASRGVAAVPWDRHEPSVLLTEWASRGQVDGSGQTAVVVGAGYGRDAEFIARLGYRTTAFDISPTAVRDTRIRFPDTAVDYVVADLLDLPPAWLGAYDLVIEDMTVQALPESMRAEATAAVASLVGPGGTLVVVAAARDVDDAVGGPPWPLTAPQVHAFGDHDLEEATLERIPDAGDPTIQRWLGVFDKAGTRHTSSALRS